MAPTIRRRASTWQSGMRARPKGQGADDYSRFPGPLGNSARGARGAKKILGNNSIRTEFFATRAARAPSIPARTTRARGRANVSLARNGKVWATASARALRLSLTLTHCGASLGPSQGRLRGGLRRRTVVDRSTLSHRLASWLTGARRVAACARAPHHAHGAVRSGAAVCG